MNYITWFNEADINWDYIKFLLIRYPWELTGAGLSDIPDYQIVQLSS